MLPRLSKSPGLSEDVMAYLKVLNEAGFSGDCESSYAARLSMATDNSLYQFLPQAVLFPRTTEDVALIARLASEEAFRKVTFAPRGGGTGTNGQSLTFGVVVDLSRHMNAILALNLEEGWVEVQAGVVKDQLNRYLKPYGYFFSPDLSTSNRATLGGMINTDASGQGSLVYGKTSDHVLSLQAVLIGGETIQTTPLSLKDAERFAQGEGLAARVYCTVYTLCQQYRALIEEKFPALNRFLTGYDLKHVFNENLTHFDLGRILTGSEGTLAFVTTARLNITPLPKVRCLVCIKYNSFDAALRHAPFLLEAKALSVETVDSHVLGLAREDIIWHQIKGLISDIPGKIIKGLNIVEFAGTDQGVIERQLAALCQRLDSALLAFDQAVLGYQVCSDPEGIERIYAMRKKAVGLLGNTAGAAKPVAFVEDTCVPPQYLADYIAEFRALLDRYHLSYGMFGHVDAGVLHVRPVLDMTDPAQQKLVKPLSDQVAALTRKYHGLLWGEHGKGVRGEYTKDFFGEELYALLQQIKAVFDPYNQLNPGKICSPAAEIPIFGVESPMRGTRDQWIPQPVREDYKGVMTCNGNGLCFNFDTYTPMCPSMKVTGDRIHSPKGRAALMREWLYLLAQTGRDPQEILAGSQLSSLRLADFVRQISNTLQARKGVYDFSHEVKDAMAGCLSCKACAAQCPVKIDVPAFKALFLKAYYGRYLHPFRDYMVAGIEYYAPLMARVPRLFNTLTRLKYAERAVEKYANLVDLPLLSTPSLAQRLRNNKANPRMASLDRLKNLSPALKAKTVVVIQDPFTSFYEASLVEALLKLIKKLGYQAFVLPFTPNGKTLHVKGFLRKFEKVAATTSTLFEEIHALGLPMVGVEPALVQCYRDEYVKSLKEQRGHFVVHQIQEWLEQVLQGTASVPLRQTQSWYLFSHCTESTASPHSVTQWMNVFKAVGLQLENVAIGCCGMAGTFGHESEHKAQSKAIYDLSWAEKLAGLPQEYCLATGYSCRSQVKRLENKRLRHPLEVILQAIEESSVL